MDIFSFMNVENVVKPPQKPTVRNISISCDIVVWREDIPQKRPIIKQPVTLATIVPSGSVAAGNNLLQPTFTKYLAIPPRKLPPPIKSNVRIICYLSSSLKNLEHAPKPFRIVYYVP